MAEREREVIVTNDGGGSGGGAVLAVVLLVGLVLVLFLLFGTNLLNGADPTTDIKADVKIETPSK
jgi:hypothetical protein